MELELKKEQMVVSISLDGSFYEFLMTQVLVILSQQKYKKQKSTENTDMEDQRNEISCMKKNCKDFFL